ncbi:MAG TPA: hypothetical protein VF670_06320 [Duganella sp.]|jgi:hypothetical protein
MTNNGDTTSFATDKQRLIREGELYRIKVVHSKALVANALHPDALFHGAVDHAVSLAQARLGGLIKPGGGLGSINFKALNYKALLPYAMTIGSFIARKKLIKPVIGVVAVAGLGVYWLSRRKRTHG